MKYLFFTFFLVGFSLSVKTQSYTVEIDDIPYDTLTEYNSIGHEKVLRGELPYWFEEQIDFGFEFPFFDTTLTYIILSNDCTGLIPDSPEYNFYLFNQSWEMYREFDFLGYLNSDYRYKRTTIDGKKVFIYESFRLMYEYFEEAKHEKSDVSFQVWFWEDGTLELRFGKIFLDSDIYFPGKGVLIKGPTEYYSHFFIEISNPNITETINVSGDLNNNPIVKYLSEFDIQGEGLRYIPKENTVCRFKKNTSKTIQWQQHINMPNIVSDMLHLPAELKIEKYHIFDSMGKLIKNGSSENVNVQDMPTGIYFAQLISGSNRYTFKFFKKLNQ
jgi:hypothetical protein